MAGMNKRLVVIIAVILSVVVISGAFIVISLNRDTGEDERDEFLPAANQFDVQDLKDAKLTIYFEARTNKALPEVLEAVNKKLKDELKTELAFEFVWDYPESYLDKVRQAVAAGSPCDAFYYSSNFPVALQALVTEGLVKDITDTFPQYAPDYYGKFSKEDIAAISTKGKIYAIPSRIPNAARRCAIVRQDLMTKYDIPEIKSYQDYEVFLDTIKKNEPGMVPMNYWDTTVGLFSDVNGYAMLNYELGLVYKWDSPAIKLEAWEQTSGFVDGLNIIKSWYDKGYLLKNIGIAAIDEDMIKGDKWASFIANWGSEIEFNAILMAEGIKDYKFKAYQLHDGVSPRNSPLESSLLVNAKSTQADRVLMFINWLQSEQENYDLLMYGIKGTHFIEEQDYITPPEGVSINDSFFNWGWKSPFRNMEYERANFSGLKDVVKQYNDIINEKTKYPPLLGFYPDYAPVADLLTARRIAFSELDQKVYTGIFEQNDVEEFIKEQKDNGVDNIILELQKQLDEFQAGN